MTLEERLSKLEQVLKHLGYLQHIKNDIEKAKRITQETLRRPKERVHNNKVITFVSTHSPRNPNLYTLIKQSIPMLNASPKIKKSLENTKIIPSKWQPPNLKKILKRERFTKNPRAEDQQNKVRKCFDLKCEVSTKIQVGSHVKLGKGNNKTRFNIEAKMDCSVRDFIYVINCNGCKEQYTGESGDTLRHGASLHRNQILHPRYRKLYVSKHISLCAIAKNPMFSICPFFKLYHQDEIFRKEKEDYFIKKFKPALNRD